MIAIFAHRCWPHRGVFRAAAVGLALTFTHAVAAQELAAIEPAPTLRADVSVSGPLVTVGDLVDGAGPLSDKAIFRAPDLGKAGSVGADVVLAALARAGMTEVDSGGLASVRVSRLSRAISAAEIADVVRAALAEALGVDAGHLDIAFDRPPQATDADPAAATPVRLASLSQAAGGRFEAVLAIGRGETDPLRVRLTGTALETAEIISVTRPIDRGEMVSSTDLATTRVPVRVAAGATAPAMESLIGLVARHPLRPGVPLTDRDLGPPVLVKRGDVVTLVYRTASLTLSVTGRALADGTQGSGVAVVNLRSDRVIQTTVTGPGVVEVAAQPRRAAVAQGVAQ